MTISPIKSIISNLTSEKLIIPVTSHMRLVLEPKGNKGSDTSVRGDIFTLMERTPVVDSLTTLLLDKKAELTYVIDVVASVVKNSGVANIDSNAALQKKVTDCNQAAEKEEPTKSENEELIKSENEELIKDESENEKLPVETEDDSKKAAPEEIGNQSNELPEEVTEEPKKEEPPKATRKPRQIKAN